MRIGLNDFYRPFDQYLALMQHGHNRGELTHKLHIMFNHQDRAAPLNRLEQFSRMVRETPAGREVKLGLTRNGTAQTITAKIGSRQGPVVAPFEIPNLNLVMPDIPHAHMSWRSGLLGIEAEAMEGQLAEFFGVKEGVLVRGVTKGSAAEKAGIKTGDVITRIDSGGVASASDITSRLRTQRGKSVPVVVMRDRKEMTVSVLVPTDDRSERLYLARPLRPAWL